jgi:hypothetical protein
MLLDLARNGTWVAALPNLSVPGANFLVLLSTLIRSRFQVKPATLLIPIDPLLGGGGGLWYPVPKWLLFFKLCGEWLSLPA